MRSTCSTLALLLGMALAAVAEGKPKGAWEFGVGSWVQTKSTTIMKVGTLEVPAQVRETRQTIVQVTAAAVIVKSEVRAGDGWTDGGQVTIARTVASGTTPGVVPPEGHETEKVTVEGKEYDCKKATSVVGGATTVFWISAEHGLLKSEWTGTGASTVTLVTSLSKHTKVGEKDIVCRETKTVSKMTGGESTVVTLASEWVPGGSVRSEMTSTVGAAITQTLTEVVAFEAK